MSGEFLRHPGNYDFVVLTPNHFSPPTMPSKVKKGNPNKCRVATDVQAWLRVL